MAASYNGHLDIVKYLHQNGADMNIQDNVSIRYVHIFINTYHISHLHNILSGWQDCSGQCAKSG